MSLGLKAIWQNSHFLSERKAVGKDASCFFVSLNESVTLVSLTLSAPHGPRLRLITRPGESETVVNKSQCAHKSVKPANENSTGSFRARPVERYL